MVTKAFLELTRLRRSQWLDPTALERIQLQQLKVLLKHAYENVAYYHHLLDSAGVEPDDVQSLDDLRYIPITTKAQLQALPTDRIVAKGTSIERCVERRTSGSTGMPLGLFITPEEKLTQTLINLRILLENGLRFSDRLAYIGDPRHFVPQNQWFQRLGVFRRINLSIFDDPEKQMRVIKEVKPDVLYGCPSSLALLASATRDSQASPTVPRLAFTTAELLSPQKRQLIEFAFNRVYDVYGTVEFGDIAWECERHEGYHINADCLVVELLRDGRQALPGEMGELVCTSLKSYAMPLIRYRLGDICVPSADECSCGRGLPLMKVVQGRADDFVSLPDGRFVSPRAVRICLRNVRGVKQYRIEQETDRKLLVQIVENEEFSAATINDLRAALSEITRGCLVIRIEAVDEIPRDKSGKIRAIVSKVSPSSGLLTSPTGVET